MNDALATDHGISQAYALSEGACPVAFFVGDRAAAERFVAMLLERAERHELGVWHALGRCFRGMLLMRRGAAGEGLPLLGGALDELRGPRSAPRYTSALAELAETLGRAGQVAQGLAAIEQALARSDRNEERWCFAELLRVKGELAPGGRAEWRDRSRRDCPGVAQLGAATGRSGRAVADGHEPCPPPVRP